MGEGDEVGGSGWTGYCCTRCSCSLSCQPVSSLSSSSTLYAAAPRRDMQDMADYRLAGLQLLDTGTEGREELLRTTLNVDCCPLLYHACAHSIAIACMLLYACHIQYPAAITCIITDNKAQYAQMHTNTAIAEASSY